jgi:alkaline phosphatase D
LFIIAAEVTSAAVTQPLPTDQPITRIAFGSCAFQWAEQPVFRAVVASNPDIYLSLGDAIYGDYDGKKVYAVTPESLRREWQTLADNPDWEYLASRVPIMATWDNHDYGHHSAGAEFPLKDVSAEIFLDFFAEPDDSERRYGPGVYSSKIFGPVGKRLQIVLLDTRTFKTPPVLSERPEGAGGSLGKYAPNADPAATLLGRAQWQWLAQELQRPADVRLIASSGQVVADEKGMDEWGNYPRERERLLRLVAAAPSGKSLLLSGNVHFSEVSAIDVDNVHIVDFTSSGLTHVNKVYPDAPNRHRVAGPYVDVGFGLVEIDWESGPTIVLRAVDVEGHAAFEYKLPWRKPG